MDKATNIFLAVIGYGVLLVAVGFVMTLLKALIIYGS